MVLPHRMERKHSVQPIAHTLKGVCLNLGFTELYKVSAELTEVLRGRETAGSDELYAQVKEQYTTLTDAIRELASN